MTYYIGLLLSDKIIIAADRRLIKYEEGVQKHYDIFNKIALISKHTYFTVAGNAGSCAEIYEYLKNNNLEHIEDINNIKHEELNDIHNKRMKTEIASIPNFEKLSNKDMYYNLSLMLGGISRPGEPTICSMNNRNGFTPEIFHGLKCIALQVRPEIDNISDNFIKKIIIEIDKLNKDNGSKLIKSLLKQLFLDISYKDNYISSSFDIVIQDKNGNQSCETL